MIWFSFGLYNSGSGFLTALPFRGNADIPERTIATERADKRRLGVFIGLGLDQKQMCRLAPVVQQDSRFFLATVEAGSVIQENKVATCFDGIHRGPGDTVKGFEMCTAQL